MMDRFFFRGFEEAFLRGKVNLRYESSDVCYAIQQRLRNVPTYVYRELERISAGLNRDFLAGFDGRHLRH